MFPLGLCLLLLLSPLLILHNDLGWHLRTGELIVDHGGVPLTDPWATTTHGFPWLNSSWGWDCIAWIAYARFGLTGLLCATAVLGALLGGLVTASSDASGAKSAAAIPVSLWMLVALLTYERPEAPLSISPQTTSLVLVAWLQLALLRTGGRQPWWSPLLFVCWANVHGGYVAGWVAIGVALGQHVLRCGTRGLSRELFVVTLCALAPLASPYGLDNYAYLVRYPSSPAIDFIFEWQPYLWDRSMPTSGFILAFLASLASSRVRRSPLLVQSILWLLTGLRHQRNIALFLVTAAPLVATGASALLRVDMRSLFPKWSAMLASGLLILSSGRIVESRFRGRVDWPAYMYPKQEIDYLREHLAGRRLFNHWNYGAFIIFRAGTSVPVFVDGRGTTAYPATLLTDLRDLSLKDILGKYEIDVVMLPLRAKDARAEMEEDQAWEHEMSGDSAVIYRRRARPERPERPAEPEHGNDGAAG